MSENHGNHPPVTVQLLFNSGNGFQLHPDRQSGAGNQLSFTFVMKFGEHTKLEEVSKPVEVKDKEKEKPLKEKDVEMEDSLERVGNEIQRKDQLDFVAQKTSDVPPKETSGEKPRGVNTQSMEVQTDVLMDTPAKTDSHGVKTRSKRVQTSSILELGDYVKNFGHNLNAHFIAKLEKALARSRKDSVKLENLVSLLKLSPEPNGNGVKPTTTVLDASHKKKRHEEMDQGPSRHPKSETKLKNVKEEKKRSAEVKQELSRHRKPEQTLKNTQEKKKTAKMGHGPSRDSQPGQKKLHVPLKKKLQEIELRLKRYNKNQKIKEMCKKSYQDPSTKPSSEKKSTDTQGKPSKEPKQGKRKGSDIDEDGSKQKKCGTDDNVRSAHNVSLASVLDSLFETNETTTGEGRDAPKPQENRDKIADKSANDGRAKKTKSAEEIDKKNEKASSEQKDGSCSDNATEPPKSSPAFKPFSIASKSLRKPLPIFDSILETMIEGERSKQKPWETTRPSHSAHNESSEKTTNGQGSLEKSNEMVQKSDQSKNYTKPGEFANDNVDNHEKTSQEPENNTTSRPLPKIFCDKLSDGSGDHSKPYVNNGCHRVQESIFGSFSDSDKDDAVSSGDQQNGGAKNGNSVDKAAKDDVSKDWQDPKSIKELPKIPKKSTSGVTNNQDSGLSCSTKTSLKRGHTSGDLKQSSSKSRKVGDSDSSSSGKSKSKEYKSQSKDLFDRIACYKDPPRRALPKLERKSDRIKYKD